MICWEIVCWQRALFWRASGPRRRLRRLRPPSCGYKMCPRSWSRLISRSRGRPNKDLAKLADQLRQIMDKWE